MDQTTKDRIQTIEQNAKNRLNEIAAPTRDKDWFKRNQIIATEPIYIASSEDIGTRRARANHFDSVLDYFQEQEGLKKAGAPIEANRPQGVITGGFQPDFTK